MTALAFHRGQRALRRGLALLLAACGWRPAAGPRRLPCPAMRGACPAGVLAQQARCIDALTATASRQVVGDALQLHDAQGRVRLRFEALYPR